MPTLIELETLEENIALCKRLNLDFVEINMNMPQFQPDKLSADYLNRLKEEHGIFFTFHLAEDIDVGHFNEGIRNAYLKVIEDSLSLLKAIDSPVLNMHMLKGIHFTLPHEKVYLYDQYREAYMSSIHRLRDLVSKSLKGSKTKVMLENMGDFDRGFLQESVSYLLEAPVFRLTYDIGHNHMSGDHDAPFLKANQSAIKHYHIHDATRQKDHLALYEGELDIDGFLNRASKTGATAVIEVKTIAALERSIKRLETRRKAVS